MKWWTREWLESDWDETESRARGLAYRQHVAEIKDSLPRGILTLAEAGGPVTLKDGYFVHATTNGRGDLELDIRNREDGTQTAGGFIEPMVLVHLVYRDFELIGLSQEQLFWRTKPGVDSVILRAEVDVLEDGRFEHRMLWWPYLQWPYDETCWVGIRCRTVDVAVVRFQEGEAVTLEAGATFFGTALQ